MRHWKNLIWFAMCCTISAAACDQDKCEPCGSDCPSFVGSYVLSMPYGQEGDTCTPIMQIPQADDTLAVVAQGGGTLSVTFPVLDASGERWAVFSGTICDSIDTEFPKSYPYSVSYDAGLIDDTVRVRYDASGEFIDWGSAEGTLSAYGVVTMTEMDLEVPEQSCMVVRRFEAL